MQYLKFFLLNRMPCIVIHIIFKVFTNYIMIFFIKFETVNMFISFNS